MKVFISYSHDSSEHADRVLELSDRLVNEGINCILDQYEDSPPEGWNMWMDRNIEDANFVLMICTETYYKRVTGEEESAKGLGVKWEGKLIYQHIYKSDSKNNRFIPVIFKSEHKEFIPTPLQDATHYCLDMADGYDDLYRRLTPQPITKKPQLGKLRTLPPRERKQNFFAAQVMLSKLPTTGKDLFGRENELKIIDEAWSESHTRILCLVAWGGVGKTALANEWLNRMERDNYRSADRVYGWSFYSQGTKEVGNASADTFFNEALKFFGFEGELPKNPWDKSSELLKLINKQPTLLILDGLEPLQYPPGPMHKELHDKGMQVFLKNLSRQNNGLCIITTRCEVKDIEHTVRNSTKEILLENLDENSGAKLLKNLRVIGTDAELKATSRKFNGHALALNLLGSYLATVHEGEICKQDLVPSLYKDEEKGSHARNVMESYEVWLKGKPELDILYLMGLFDRPAPRGAIDVLLGEPAIKGLTDNLQTITPEKLQFALKRLSDLKLLANVDETSREVLDCHPLVREHFGEKLKKNNLHAWKEAHSRLYEYYKKLPKKELPDTLEEMEPLFAAVAHGCQAGRYQEALVDGYWSRISRKTEQFVVSKLGAYGSALSALSNFFELPWSKVVANLTSADKAVTLSWAGYSLRALGRLREAIQPMQAGLNSYVKQKHWEYSAIAAGNLSELYLISGDVPQAISYARQSVDFADRSGDVFVKGSDRTTLADSLHQYGELMEAHQLFREAESMQKEREQNNLFLYAMRGFRFCDLLLERRKFIDVQMRAGQALEIAKQNRQLLSIALINFLWDGRICCKYCSWSPPLRWVPTLRRWSPSSSRQRTT